MRFLKFSVVLILVISFLSEIVFASEYIAFSLKVAQERIVSTAKAEDYRKLHPEVFFLGGITKIKGLVYDSENEDLILLGERELGKSPLTLDDFVVALKARFVFGKWPLVSIDPTEETQKTEMQIIRFEGGIEDTQFGEDLFSADYRLKQISIGILPHGLPGFMSHWDLFWQNARHSSQGRRINIARRFWFYPILQSVMVREDVVSIKGLKVGVFTELLSAEVDGHRVEDLSTFQDPSGTAFIAEVNKHFDALAKEHPCLARLTGLNELVALTKAIEEMDHRPTLSFWLNNYQIKKVEIEKKVKLLRRRKEDERRYVELSGGVHLTAIALKLNAGDIKALRQAVLLTRPTSNQLIWRFKVSSWDIQVVSYSAGQDTITSIWLHAIFLFNNNKYREALECFNDIIQLDPTIVEAYAYRGYIFNNLGDYTNSILNFSKAIELNPNYVLANAGLGNSYLGLGEFKNAISEYDKVIKLNIIDGSVYYNRGVAHYRVGNYAKAEENWMKALEIDPTRLGKKVWWALFELRNTQGRKNNE